ncbi:Helix-turn-helix [Pseudobutyrivibrio sp. YE44]|uniref:helix-turn-helix domain-containing protein n=1 Tax=Pseudobutyrivibrio sp. YE44 TaxID=1520802 RepID=UPI000891B1C6|nr:helix-turn-helix transcriptional regulator [Pseudobutyrivibrio sp. YE44]SDB45240.1 Helix-turn-helix [Pseudobutyrivibrio sp. YE44]
MDHSTLEAIRKEKGFSRDDVADLTNDVISSKRLEHIEKGETVLNPSDLIVLSEIYDKPELCLNYCSSCCAIGKNTIPMYEFNLTQSKDLPIITLELLDTLNSLVAQKDRIISIAADGEITEDEKSDFQSFNDGLEKMELVIKSLKLWAQKNS